MSAAFAGYGASRRSGRIALSTPEIEEGAVAGTVVGTLSTSRGPGWSFFLVDNAGGLFALDGRTIVAGATATRSGGVSPRIFVVATDGRRTAAELIGIDVLKSLPVLPLAKGARIAVHGDSQSGFNNAQGQNGISVADAAAQSVSYGAVEQLFAADPRFNFDSWFDPADPFKRNLAGANQGLFGDHMEWARLDWGNGILPRPPQTLAKGGQIVILQGGTNSIASGDAAGTAVPADASYVIAKLDACLRLCRKAGRWVVIETLLPRGDWPAGDPRRDTLAAVNTWIRAQAGRRGVLGIWDSWDVLAPNGTMDPTMFLEGAEGVHRNQKGAHAAALLGAASLKAIVANAVEPGSVFDQDPATANLFGAAVGQLTGTGGTRIGASSTGTVATGCTLRLVRGSSTQVAAKEVVAGAVNRQALTITPVNDANAAGYHQSDFTLPVVATGLPEAASWLRGYLFVEIGDTQAVSHVLVNFRVQDGTTDRVVARAMSGNSLSFRTGAPGGRGFWAATKPFQLPAGVAFDRIAASASIVFSMTAEPFTVKFSRPILRTSPDPRPAWGY